MVNLNYTQYKLGTAKSIEEMAKPLGKWLYGVTRNSLEPKLFDDYERMAESLFAVERPEDVRVALSSVLLSGKKILYTMNSWLDNHQNSVVNAVISRRWPKDSMRTVLFEYSRVYAEKHSEAWNKMKSVHEFEAKLDEDKGKDWSLDAAVELASRADPAQQIAKFLGERLYLATLAEKIEDRNLDSFEKVRAGALKKSGNDEHVAAAFSEGRKLLYTIWAMKENVTRSAVCSVLDGRPYTYHSHDPVLQAYVAEYEQDLKVLSGCEDVARYLKTSPLARLTAKKILAGRVIKYAELAGPDEPYKIWRDMPEHKRDEVPVYMTPSKGPHKKYLRDKVLGLLNLLRQREVIFVTGGEGGSVIQLNTNKKRVLEAFFEGWFNPHEEDKSEEEKAE